MSQVATFFQKVLHTIHGHFTASHETLSQSRVNIVAFPNDIVLFLLDEVLNLSRQVQNERMRLQELKDMDRTDAIVASHARLFGTEDDPSLEGGSETEAEDLDADTEESMLSGWEVLRRVCVRGGGGVAEGGLRHRSEAIVVGSAQR